MIMEINWCDGAKCYTSVFGETVSPLINYVALNSDSFEDILTHIIEVNSNKDRHKRDEKLIMDIKGFLNSRGDPDVIEGVSEEIAEKLRKSNEGSLIGIVNLYLEKKIYLTPQGFLSFCHGQELKLVATALFDKGINLSGVLEETSKLYRTINRLFDGYRKSRKNQK